MKPFLLRHMESLQLLFSMIPLNRHTFEVSRLWSECQFVSIVAFRYLRLEVMIRYLENRKLKNRKEKS